MTVHVHLKYILKVKVSSLSIVSFQSGFCMCAVNKTTRGDLRDIQLDYYHKLNELVESGRYDTSDDFTVVIQPHQRDIKPVLDVS